MARSNEKDESQGRRRRSSDRDETGDRPKTKRDDSEKGERRRSRLEGMVPDIVRKAMVSGLGAIFMTEESIRSTLSDMPKEAVNFLVNQADQTKEQLLNLIAREVREFLESADLSEELSKVLARLTLDIRTQIRFVSSESDDGGFAVTPDMEYDVQVVEKPKKKK